MKSGAEQIADERSKSGADLITAKRNEQLEKVSIKYDVNFCDKNQLAIAAQALLHGEDGDSDTVSAERIDKRPKDWSAMMMIEWAHSDYKDRLIIAGALIAAEIDRLQYVENKE